jgi:hypothetical protein
MEKIEGYRFSAFANLASDFRTFLRILADQPEVKALQDDLESESVLPKVFGRLLELADCPVEGENEHPADAALAAYLWLLSSKSSNLAEIAAETILKRKHCWWSHKMAEQVQKATQLHSRPAG